ncbi:hypothetical protein DPEC_G00284660 [Dallia pectoralis]|uniref:Uncharacterized protein n=1 Tax=Dallia pectoralis TaxID=75939 RepID=A0ACC2FJK0_DALPE|nr:hypothetical protein DPEC_G00284660 [Dallia pectoralis]
MEVIETTYDDANALVDFIDCPVCSKTIRGDTLFKIHLTTIQHMKKEDALVALGRATRTHEVPDFKDIKQYLQFLDLDEPIIGLNALDEVDDLAHDTQPGPKYFCRMCDLHANLPNMVNHIIGRKHRQKYLEANRPDLITWGSSNSQAQSGKTIRAKAVVLERQDGQGNPKPLRKNVGKLNIQQSKVKKKGSQDQPKGTTRQGPSLPRSSNSRQNDRLRRPGGLDSPAGQYQPRARRPEDEQYRALFHKSRPEANLREGDRRLNGFEEDRTDRVAFREDLLRRRPLMEDEFSRRGRRNLEEKEHSRDYFEGTGRREIFEESGSRPGQPDGRAHQTPDLYHQTSPGDLYHQSQPGDLYHQTPPGDLYHQTPPGDLYHQTSPGDLYPGGPSHSRVHPGHDPLAQFYSEEVLRRASHHAEASKERVFREEEPPHDRGYSHGASFPEEFPLEQAYTDKPTLYLEHAHGRPDHRQDDTRRREYEEEARQRAYPEEVLQRPTYLEANPNRSLNRDPNARGYLKGLDRQAAAEQDRRVTDQTEEPMETGRQRNRDHSFDSVNANRHEGRGREHPEAERGLAHPGMRGPPPRTIEKVKTDIPEPFRRFLKGALKEKSPLKRKRKTRFSDATEQERDVVVNKMHVDDIRRRHEPFAQPQGGYYDTDNLRPVVEATPYPGNVLDSLNNIKVENVEDANFLKEKLCDLLKEFQAQKSQKAALAPGYESMHPAIITKDYNHISKEHLECSRVDERTYRELPDERHYEGHPPRHSQECYTPEPPQGPYGRRPGDIDKKLDRRSQYEEAFGQVKVYPESYDFPDEPRAYPHEMYPRDFPPAEDVYDRFGSSTPAQRERGYRVGAPQSTSLDKITSTLLELVARKR